MLLKNLESSPNTVIPAHARLYGSTQDLSEAQKKTDQQLAELAGTMRELAEAQMRTEESLRRFIDRSGNGHAS